MSAKAAELVYGPRKVTWFELLVSVTWPLLPARVPVTSAPVWVTAPIGCPVTPSEVVPVEPVVMPAKATESASRIVTAVAELLVVTSVPSSEIEPLVVPSKPSSRMSPALALIAEPADCVMPAPWSEMLP